MYGHFSPQLCSTHVTFIYEVDFSLREILKVQAISREKISQSRNSRDSNSFRSSFVSAVFRIRIDLLQGLEGIRLRA